jgi:hypothetical protein
MEKSVSAIVMLVAAAVLWYMLTIMASVDADAALDLGKKYLGFATALAGVLGIAIGTGSLLKDGSTADGSTTTFTGLLVTLAGGAMIGGDPVVPAAALVAGGLLGGVYILKKA